MPRNPSNIDGAIASGIADTRERIQHACARLNRLGEVLHRLHPIAHLQVMIVVEQALAQLGTLTDRMLLSSMAPDDMQEREAPTQGAGDAQH
jgi:hypothetical protein